MPTMAIVVTIRMSGHCITVSCSEKANPLSELAEMITSDVPIACLIGSFKKLTSVGIIKNPPPAPTSPVSTPISMPSMMSHPMLVSLLVSSKATSFVFLIMLIDAKSISTAKRSISNTLLVSSKLPTEYTKFGMAGKI